MRKQFRFSVVLFLLCLCSSYSDARADICIADRLNVSHITGRVVALVGRIEEPVPNASVELKQLIDDHWVTKFTATSDDKGLFHIDDAPTGKYEMYVTATHFHAFGTRVHLKASKSKPAREIVVTLGPGTHDCGAAQVRRLT